MGLQVTLLIGLKQALQGKVTVRFKAAPCGHAERLSARLANLVVAPPALSAGLAHAGLTRADCCGLTKRSLGRDCVVIET